MFEPTKESLELLREMSKTAPTMHHHHHILFDIASMYPTDHLLNYVEIGCCAGGSSSFMLQRPNTQVVAIDLGSPVTEEAVVDIVKKHNIHNNIFVYIKGDSHSLETKDRLLKFIRTIDILFVDGGHFKNDVLQDFALYSELVAKNGFIVFDDYRDWQYSPEVKIAVDQLVSTITGYEILGTFPNTLEAYPKECKEGNCFVVRKLF